MSSGGDFSNFGLSVMGQRYAVMFAKDRGRDPEGALGTTVKLCGASVRGLAPGPEPGRVAPPVARSAAA